MALKMIGELLLTRMLITLNIFANKFESYANGYCLPLEMKVGVAACCFQPKVLPLEHSIPNQLRVIVGSNDEPELQRIKFWRLCYSMRTELGLSIYIFMLYGGVKVHHSLPIIHLLGRLHLHLMLLLVLPIVYQQIGLLGVCQVLQLDLRRVVHDLLRLGLKIGVVLV